ncbi:cytochrome c-like protein [Amanita rubescens]|nr:cytochrome c-like protein [Amanita rubescens]
MSSSLDGAADLFQKYCSSCHTINAGGSHGAGPNLHKAYGRTSGTAQGFSYSRAMREKAVKWDDSTLDSFLKGPNGYIPGTIMYFDGISNDSERSEVIKYLKDNSA